MLKERIISAAIFVPVVLALIFLGGLPLFLGILYFFYVGLKEYVALLKNRGINLPHKNMLVLALIFALVAYFIPDTLGLAIALSFGIISVWVVVKQESFESFAYGVCGMIYICWGMSHVIIIRQMEEGVLIMLFCMLIPWLTDAGAYAVGMLFGKHKMIPAVSPKKSWEGAIGGVIICILGVLAFNALTLEINPIYIIIIAALGSVLGQIGDLLESWMKRWADIKDSGNFMPGHGGILDRFDSTLFVAPYIYYVFLVLDKIIS